MTSVPRFFAVGQVAAGVAEQGHADGHLVAADHGPAEAGVSVDHPRHRRSEVDELLLAEPPMVRDVVVADHVASQPTHARQHGADQRLVDLGDLALLVAQGVEHLRPIRTRAGLLRPHFGRRRSSDRQVSDPAHAASSWCASRLERSRL
jgi:hypothetical protein